MVMVFPTAFVSVPPDSFSLIGACKLGVIDSSNSYLLEVGVVGCPVFWDDFWVVWFVVIPGSCEFWTPNCVIIPSSYDEVGEVVWL